MDIYPVSKWLWYAAYQIEFSIAYKVQLIVSLDIMHSKASIQYTRTWYIPSSDFVNGKKLSHVYILLVLCNYEHYDLSLSTFGFLNPARL